MQQKILVFQPKQGVWLFYIFYQSYSLALMFLNLSNHVLLFSFFYLQIDFHPYIKNDEVMGYIVAFDIENLFDSNSDF